MLFTAERIKYQETRKFSRIVHDYLNNEKFLQPFFSAAPNLEGLKGVMEQKKKQNIDRKLLHAVLEEQYRKVAAAAPVDDNIAAILSADTFTICTAHQPNLFTGPLYFMYKILHTIRITQYLKQQLPRQHFVPGYYMGSEDADLDELNHTFLQGKKYEWTTAQTGAVGRMMVDKALLQLMNEMNGQLSVLPSGAAVMQLFRDCYQPGRNIQEATFQLVHTLFQSYGLVVLIPDNAGMKKKMQAIFEEDLFVQQPSAIVTQTCARLSENCDVQAYPRDINLFYLHDNMRERIVAQGDEFTVLNSNIRFTASGLRNELATHPERFSPNVILRGLFQESVLPNLAFVGGGGELAYWLQLKDLFDHYRVPFPVLVLRNSFLLIEKKWDDLIRRSNIPTPHLFYEEWEILNSLLEQWGKKPGLNGQLQQLETVYEILKQSALQVDASLQQHVEALKSKAVNRLRELEKKMQRAERKKHEVLRSHIRQIRNELFPSGGLQERRENFSTYYAKWGPGFIDALLQHSLLLEQEFVILREI